MKVVPRGNVRRCEPPFSKGRARRGRTSPIPSFPARSIIVTVRRTACVRIRNLHLYHDAPNRRICGSAARSSEQSRKPGARARPGRIVTCSSRSGRVRCLGPLGRPAQRVPCRMAAAGSGQMPPPSPAEQPRPWRSRSPTSSPPIPDGVADGRVRACRRPPHQATSVRCRSPHHPRCHRRSSSGLRQSDHGAAVHVGFFNRRAFLAPSTWYRNGWPAPNGLTTPSTPASHG